MGAQHGVRRSCAGGRVWRTDRFRRQPERSCGSRDSRGTMRGPSEIYQKPSVFRTSRRPRVMDLLIIRSMPRAHRDVFFVIYITRTCIHIWTGPRFAERALGESVHVITVISVCRYQCSTLVSGGGRLNTNYYDDVRGLLH